MTGLSPLSYATIESWSRLKNMSPTPSDVDTLLLLDAVLLNPPEEDKEDGDA
jgi:hypothetical protein